MKNSSSNGGGPTRKLSGYSFNNGAAKQPVVRAQEFECDPTEDCVYEHVSSVDLNFNFWMEHSYAVDKQVTQLITYALLNRQRPPALVKKKEVSSIKNVVLVSVQGVDPGELNESIDDLPFLCGLSSMPVRHLLDSNSRLLTSDEAPSVQGGGDMQWQYMDTETACSSLLWTNRPPVPMSEVVGMGLPELLDKHTLSFVVSHSLYS